MYRLCKEFRFESAHKLQRNINSEESSQIHGHSYRVEVILKGKPNKKTGMIDDAELIETRFSDIKNKLNHKILNDIEGLSVPTIENISFFIWNELKPILPGLDKVIVYRDSLFESCSYSEEIN
tara:strand:- start:161 stop:529 length:369 start_codon:yes stop_codon:yes gene_type:complete